MKLTTVMDENQRKLWEQLYPIMDKQVQSYHKSRHMGVHSSVSVELAQELMNSILYTIQQIPPAIQQEKLECTLQMGQDILKNKWSKAKRLWTLIAQSAPEWQPEGRWKAIQCMKAYLQSYDYQHMAHRTSDDFYYPIMIAPPEGVQGIDWCLFYLNILWSENQIMIKFRKQDLDTFWDRLPSDTINPCEHILLTGLGKALIGSTLSPLSFSGNEYEKLIPALYATKEEQLNQAAETLCQWLNLESEHTTAYIRGAIPLLKLWTGERSVNCILENVFL